jgi:hypothetical protein
MSKIYLKNHPRTVGTGMYLSLCSIRRQKSRKFYKEVVTPNPGPEQNFCPCGVAYYEI